jgi:hypothetical protein
LDYNVDEAKNMISEYLGWRDYGGKHYESVFTRFYQGFILPEKFSIDKRKAHLSTLICSGQMSREQALLALQQPIYDSTLLKLDRDFVLKKLGLSEEAFENYLRAPRREHTEYKHEKGIWDDLPWTRILRPAWRMFKKMRSK